VRKRFLVLLIACPLLLLGCALSQTADEARIAGGVGISGAVAQVVGLEVSGEVVLRRYPDAKQVDSVGRGSDRGRL